MNRASPSSPSPSTSLLSQSHAGNTWPALATNDTSSLHVAGDRWEREASIVLLGIRGTGKTSLAVLAASCLCFRLVDADQHFYTITGEPRAVYASKHGFEQYRKRELKLMQSLLQENPYRCIIVCGLGSAENTGQEMLEDFKKRHPVIYIMRDPDEISQYLRTLDPAEIARLSHLATPSYRSLSNYEFYNLSEPVNPLAEAPSKVVSQQYHPSLMLKHVEQDFLRLICSISSQNHHSPILQARHSLSFLAAERRPFTYALTIPLKNVTDIAPLLRSEDLLVDALELVIDLELLLANGGSFDHSTATGICKQYYILRRNVRLPVIFHVKLPDSWRLSPPTTSPNVSSTYFEILSYGLRLAPEYLSLDLTSSQDSARALIAQKASTKIIGHFFDPAPTDDAWDLPSRLNLLETADRWGCDLVRICQPASSSAHNAAVQRFIYRAGTSEFSHLPLIAYNTGRMGRNSCFMNQILTPVTHDILLRLGSGPSSHEILTVQAAQNALYSSFVLDPLVFGIFGDAVNSAMSPTMHNAAFRFCRLPHHYKTIQSSSLHDIEGIVHDTNFGGASISAPFKKEIIPVLDYVSPEAQAIGAVNTIIPLRSRNLESLIDRNRAGPVVALYGDNTDWIGIHTCIRRHLSPINAVKARTTALVIGAGGMAQAAIYSAIRLGVRTIFICNRTLANAEEVAKQFHGKSFSIHNIDLTRTGPSVKGGTSTHIDRRTEPAAVNVIPAEDESWPAGFDPPTIIVSCIARVSQNGRPPPDNVIPSAWLASPTGGVVIEVG